MLQRVQYDSFLDHWEHIPQIPSETYHFWAVHTEQAGYRILGFVTHIMTPSFLVMMSIHLLFSGIQVRKQEVLVSLPIYLCYALVWYQKQFLQRILRRWPVLLGSVIHVTLNAFSVSATVGVSCIMPNQLMQHRMFLANYLALLFGGTVAFYVPWPVFLLFNCPMYLCGWYLFHGFVGFLTVPCLVYGPGIIAIAIYLVHLKNLSLWHGHEAKEALLKERQLLQKTQESLHGVLSSIFDASCTCDSSGRVLECSSHLQEILDCSPSCRCASFHPGFNLCSFAASDAEGQRLTAFLKNATRSARQQAAKIQCSFLRRLGGLIEVCLYAIVLPATASMSDEPDTLFIALQFQSAELDSSKQMAEQDVQESGQELISWKDELQHATKGLSFMDECIPLANVADMDLCTWDSLSLSASLPSVLNPPSVIAQTIQHAVVLTADAEVQTSSMDEFVSLANLVDKLDLAKLDSSILPASLSSVNDHHSVETRTADAGVQTIGSAAKPPRSNTAAELRSRKRHCEIPSRTREIAIRGFKSTPRSTIQEVIYMNAAQCINPICSPGCCLQHAVLKVLRHEISSMLRTYRCRSWDERENLLQCAGCLCLQSKDDDGYQFMCEFCDGVDFWTQNNCPNAVDGSPTSGGAADSEHEGS